MILGSINPSLYPRQVFLSTIAGDAAVLAERRGLGLEIAEFCTAENMDAGLARYDAVVRGHLSHAGHAVMHAPFNELCPAAIDPLVLDIARKRYAQAYGLARRYGIKKLVAHSGYVPLVYFREYFVERSVEFWREFLADKPGDFELVLENVLEDSPDMLVDIVKGVGDGRLKLCFDVGHANIVKKGLTIEEWTLRVLPHLGHVHLHNNRGWPDSHGALGDGEIDIERLLKAVLEGQPAATVTIETAECRSSLDWLAEKGFLVGD